MINNREATKVIQTMLAVTDLRVRSNLTADMVTACRMAIKALEQTEWITVNSPEDYPKESGDYLTVLKDTEFHDYEYTDITSFDCDGILAEWDLKPQYKVVAWKYFEPYKGDTE